jgi:hypothetical protein
LSLDAPLRKVAKSVLAKFGTGLAIRRVTGSAYSPATRSMNPQTTDTEIKGRFFQYTDRQMAANPSIKAGDRGLEIAAADVPATPKISDKIVYDSSVFDIVNIETIQATDEAALYVLQLRR